jgi:alginate O-acetyltransferase complex protein AlgI
VFLHTPIYLAFLFAVCLLHRLLPRPFGRKVFLLLASYGMYAAFDVRFPVVLLAITAATFWLGRLIPRSPHPRAWAALSVSLSLGALAYFKYAGFFLANAESLLRGLGVPPPASVRVLLPIGISFYAFQAVAYTLEVAKRKIPPADNAVDFGLYMAFFPKLVAGPFVRPADFLRQLSNPRPAPNRGDIQNALPLLLTGLFKKVVVADGIASLADISFRAAASPGAAGFPMPMYIAGFYLYAVQIYADFSGYTDIARASAGLLGFSLPENFRQPYFSISPAGFWNRWHMTLTQWFREYLFFPLSRWGMIRTNRRYPRLIQAAATTVTMVLIGFWHGGAWTFLVWGAWHGVLVAVDRLAGISPRRWWEKIFFAAVTFHLVGVGWILFRSDTLDQAGRFLAGMVSFLQPVWFSHFLPPAMLALLLILGMDAGGALERRFPQWIRSVRPAAALAAVIVVAGLWILQAVSQTNSPPFIYGSF